MKFLSALLLAGTLSASAQTGWQPVGDYPASSPATCIHLTENNLLLVGTANGLLVRNPVTHLWETAGPALPVYLISSHPDQGIWVSFEGALYQANSSATGWTEVTVPFNHNVRDILLTSSGVAVATADAVSHNGIGHYEGSGVWFKPNGQPWTERNAGMTGSLSFWQLEQGPGGHWYAASANDRAQSGPAHLYKSENQGLSWEVITLTYEDPQNGSRYPVEMTFPVQLLFWSHGLLLSLEGNYSTVPLMFGSRTPWNELGPETILHPFSLGPSATPYQAVHPHRLQVLPGGNLLGSRLSLGLLETTHPDSLWEVRNTGLNPTYYAGSQPRHHPVQVVVDPSGTYYAIQESDPVLYTRSGGLGAPAEAPERGWSLYPNPAGCSLTLAFDRGQLPEEVLFIAPDGRVPLQIDAPGEEQIISIEALQAGIYTVLCRFSSGSTTALRLVITH